MRRIKKQRFYLIAMVPFVVYALTFFYYPMYGVVLAFKEFSYSKGILGSPWAGFRYFEQFLFSSDFPMVLRNTLVMSGASIFLGFPIPIIFAILISEMRNRGYKRFVQTVSYLPHFIAWIVVAGMTMQLLSMEGTLNSILIALGVSRDPIHFLGMGGPFFWFLVFVLKEWKEIGWSAIIYIAAISSIDPNLYEAAMIDGASKFQRIVRITIPQILPTAIVLFVLSLGYVLSAGFEVQLFLMNPLNQEFAEVIDTYVFKYGLQRFMFSYGAAVGLLKAAVALVLVLFSNWVMKRTTSMGIF